MTTEILPAATARPARRSGGPTHAPTRAPYVFIAPFYVLYLLFMVVPILASVYLSLTEWVGLGTPSWIGLRNYADLLSDSSFHKALANTGIYVLVAVLVIVPISLLLATALNARGLKARDTFRVTFFVPMVVSPIVVALIFSLVFDKQFGLANAGLQAVFGSGGIDWLGDPWLAKLSIALVTVWRWSGYLTIFFLAGLQNVPKDLYEAAALDGAGWWRSFRAVTLPSLRPVTAFVVVTSFISAAQIFDEPFLLTRGGPNDQTISVALFIYRAAFERQQFGYAAAAGVVLFVVVFAISQAFNRLLGIGRSS